MTEIIVAAPYCTPQRNTILTPLHGYGVTPARIVDAYCIYPDGARGPESGLGRNIPLRLIYHVRVTPRPPRGPNTCCCAASSSSC